jgi:hypothetical protein
MFESILHGEQATDGSVRQVSDALHSHLFTLAGNQNFRYAGGQVQSQTTWVHNAGDVGLFWRITTDTVRPQHDLRNANAIEIFLYPHDQMGRFVLSRIAHKPVLQVDDESRSNFSAQDLLDATGVRRVRTLFDWLENHAPKASARVEKTNIRLTQAFPNRTTLHLQAAADQAVFRNENEPFDERRLHARLSILALNAGVILDTTIVQRQEEPDPSLVGVSYGLSDGSDIRPSIPTGTLDLIQMRGFEMIDSASQRIEQMNGFRVAA